MLGRSSKSEAPSPKPEVIPSFVPPAENPQQLTTCCRKKAAKGLTAGLWSLPPLVFYMAVLCSACHSMLIVWNVWGRTKVEC